MGFLEANPTRRSSSGPVMFVREVWPPPWWRRAGARQRVALEQAETGSTPKRWAGPPPRSRFEPHRLQPCRAAGEPAKTCSVRAPRPAAPTSSHRTRPACRSAAATCVAARPASLSQCWPKRLRLGGAAKVMAAGRGRHFHECRLVALYVPIDPALGNQRTAPLRAVEGHQGEHPLRGLGVLRCVWGRQPAGPGAGPAGLALRGPRAATASAVLAPQTAAGP